MLASVRNGCAASTEGTAMTIGRREWVKGVASGSVALTLGDLITAQPSRAAELKLAGAKEFTTACNFCSCGCGMVGHVIDGKLVNLEGDPDHVVNEGALCVKGSAMLATHESPQRLGTPRYRAPGSDHWVDISWDDALDKLARKLKATRDATWVATDKHGDKEYPANRTDAIALLGGAQNTNEECYLWTKLGRLLGTNYVEHQARL
jgi:formate dehydrogenase major subunit